MVKRVNQVFPKKKNQRIQKTKLTSDRMEISSTDTEFQSKTMKLTLLLSFLQVPIVADHPTMETALNLLIFHPRITSLNKNNDYNTEEL